MGHTYDNIYAHDWKLTLLTVVGFHPPTLTPHPALVGVPLVVGQSGHCGFAIPIRIDVLLTASLPNRRLSFQFNFQFTTISKSCQLLSP